MWQHLEMEFEGKIYKIHVQVSSLDLDDILKIQICESKTWDSNNLVYCQPSFFHYPNKVEEESELVQKAVNLTFEGVRKKFDMKWINVINAKGNLHEVVSRRVYETDHGRSVRYKNQLHRVIGEKTLQIQLTK